MDYKIIKILSEHKDLGSTVELAEDLEGHRFVVKRIDHIETAISRAIFQKEIQALFRLKACKNIVRIYRQEIHECCEGHTEGIISMEYVEGRPLSCIVNQIPNAVTRYRIGNL